MTSPQSVSVACVNFRTTWGDKEANLNKMEAFTREAARLGNHLVVFPELALSGYECSDEAEVEGKPCRMHRELAEEIPGPSTERMWELARELDVYIIFGMPEKAKAEPERRHISSAVMVAVTSIVLTGAPSPR